jgi:N-acetylglucosaminyl-diphospho-decaprenol L-rhamnosyltransferase
MARNGCKAVTVSESSARQATFRTPDLTVDIVIVNWNSKRLLRESLAALDQSTIAGQLNVIVVDNASADGSADALVAERAQLDIVRNTENRGFAAACNQGAKKGRAPLLLFVNPDVRVRPDTVAAAVRYLDDPGHSGVGVLGVQLTDADGHVQRCCARTPTAVTLLLQTLFLDRLVPALVPPHFLTEWDHADTRRVDQVMGAFLMIRRALFEELRGFDERFFLYYEDVDLCLAARQAGSEVVHYAGAQASHMGGGSTVSVKDRRLYHHARSRVAYVAKRHGRGTATLLTGLILFAEMPIRWLHATLTRSPREGWLVIRGMALSWRDLLSLASHRGRE